MSPNVIRVSAVVKGLFSRFPTNVPGLTARECNLIASLILIGAIGPFTTVGPKLSAIFG
jgi:Flp pilus assembly pilin Flp